MGGRVFKVQLNSWLKFCSTRIYYGRERVIRFDLLGKQNANDAYSRTLGSCSNAYEGLIQSLPMPMGMTASRIVTGSGREWA
ncbi:hypothetical protein VNO77_02397 [Canavalia gladiata]|uniref:Uncharacterized protein n=1 Tax=Canavalia gladiata TaxID=3824 RepID=A0AAN9MT05_CANGL